MYAETIDAFARLAEKELAVLRRAPGGFFVSSMLAGAYVGMGIILIFILGNIVGGAVFVAGAYHVSTYGFPRPAPLPGEPAVEAKSE